MSVNDRPALSWSLSRHRTFAECERRGYWQYYGSHGGWDWRAPEEAQAAYRAKQLTTLAGAVGIEIHKRAAEITDAIRHCEPWPSEEEAWQKTRNALNGLWLSSRQKEAFVRAPKHNPMLLDVWYGRDIPRGRVDRAREKAIHCLANLYRWEGWQEVERTFPRVFEATEPIKYRRVPMYAAPDMVYRPPEGPTVIVDWKTGSLKGAEQQIHVYALYLLEHSDHEFDGYGMGRVVGLNDGEDREFEITPATVASARRFVADSIRNLRSHLVGLDAERNEPVPREQFLIRPSDQKCRWCPFLELCRPELEEIEGPF